MFKADSKIFVAYEDSDSLSAISKFKGFPEAMPPIPATEETNTVNFSEFWAEKSWATAVTAVNEADLIVVSLSGHANLPVPVQRWMDTWPKYKQENHTTLVVVFGNEPTDSARQEVLISYFQKIAENHGLDFLCNCDNAKALPSAPPSPEPTHAAETSRSERYPVMNLFAAAKAA